MTEPFESKWLYFVEAIPEADAKTCKWIVRGKQNGVQLGLIRWYGAWRQYVFYPQSDRLFNRGCLRDIADFCEHVHKRRAYDA